MRPALLACAIGLVASTPPYWNSCTENFSGGQRLSYPFCDPAVALDDRIADLVGRLTWEEKCAALDTGNPAIPRLGVPSLPNGEGLHGVVSGCGAGGGNATGCPTSFPCPTGLGATFDRGLYTAVGNAIGLEARGLNNQGVAAGVYLFAPNVNMIRDPRWGRNQEVHTRVFHVYITVAHEKCRGKSTLSWSLQRTRWYCVLTVLQPVCSSILRAIRHLRLML